MLELNVALERRSAAPPIHEESDPVKLKPYVGLLSVSLVLVTATQLRVSFGFGIGEVGLVVWLFLTFLQRVAVVPDAGLALFWRISAILLTLPALGPLAFRKLSTGFVHDLLAYSLIAVTVLTLSAFDSVVLRSVARLYALLVTGSMLTLYFVPSLASGLGLSSNDGARFLGWMQNPNQLAVAMLWIPYFCVSEFRIANASSQKVLRWSLLLCAFGSLFMGWASASDSYRISVGAALLWLGGRGYQRRFRKSSNRSLAIAFGMVFVMFLIPVTPTIVKAAGSYYLEQRNQNGRTDGGGRGELQKTALEAWTYSPVWGLGAGSYSGDTGPFQNREAHNSLIDWMMSTGTIGAVLLVSLMRRVMRIALSLNIWLSMAVVATIMFSTGHHLLRQPVVWLLVPLILSQKPEGSIESDGAGIDAPSRPALSY